jgi:hypothetical protein
MLPALLANRVRLLDSKTLRSQLAQLAWASTTTKSSRIR